MITREALLVAGATILSVLTTILDYVFYKKGWKERSAFYGTLLNMYADPIVGIVGATLLFPWLIVLFVLFGGQTTDLSLSRLCSYSVISYLVFAIGLNVHAKKFIAKEYKGKRTWAGLFDATRQWMREREVKKK